MVVRWAREVDAAGMAPVETIIIRRGSLTDVPWCMANTKAMRAVETKEGVL
jgi:hypothetical protein